MNRMWVRLLAMMVIVGIDIAGTIALLSAVSPALTDSNCAGPYRSYASGVLRGHELWYLAGERPSYGDLERKLRYSLRAVDLRTGRDRETGLSFLATSRVHVADGNGDLWINDPGDSVYRLEGTTLVRLGAALAVTTGPPAFCADMFPFEGVPATVRELEPSRYRIVLLRDGQWRDGPEILLPGVGRTWEDTSDGRGKTLLSRWAQQPVRKNPPSMTLPVLRVQFDGSQHHLFFDEIFWSFSAYRCGFDFRAASHSDVSALVPENAVPETTGWEFVLDDPRRFVRTFGISKGLPWVSCSMKGPLFRRQAPNEFIRQPAPPVTDQTHRYFLSSSTAEGFLVTTTFMGATRVYPISDVSAQPLLELPGVEHVYVRNCVKSLIPIALFHLVFLFGGATLVRRWLAETSDGRIENLTRTARLGSPLRRAVARGIDVLLLATPVLALIASDLAEMDSFQYVHSLIGWEMSIRSVIPRSLGDAYSMWVVNSPLRLKRQEIVDVIRHINPVLNVAIALWLLKCIVEGRSGITPGKWLLGLRTVSSTLAPTGIPRAIVRDVLMVFDVAFMLTAIPAAFCMATSPRCQRLGDLAIDTLVVSASSLTSLDPGVRHSQLQTAAGESLFCGEGLIPQGGPACFKRGAKHKKYQAGRR